MFWKALRIVLAACVLQLLYLGMSLGTTYAQDFSTLVQEAQTTNQKWLTAIDTASQSTDLATFKAGAATALALGEQMQSLLQQALPLAPDDAARSRISGLLAHVNNAVDAGKRIQNDTTLQAAQSDLNAERAEAHEAYTELTSFTQSTTPAPTSTSVPTTTTTTTATTTTTLPTTGGTPLSVIAGIGLFTLLAGVGLRRRLA